MPRSAAAERSSLPRSPSIAAQTAFVIRKSKASARDAADRLARGEKINRQQVHLHRAGNDLRDHRGVAAELAVGEDADLEPAIARLPDLVGGDLRPGHGWMLHW